MKKNISEIDENFIVQNFEHSDLVFKSCFEKPFKIFGLYKPHENMEFRRVSPKLEKNNVFDEAMHELMRHTAGGRVRFKTDSPRIAVRVVLNGICSLPHMSPMGTMGVDMYSKVSDLCGEQEYVTSFMPEFKDDGCSFCGEHIFSNDLRVMRDITINLPNYCKVSSVYIGLSKSAEVFSPTPFKIKKPIVFYGSSITQGACASRPGNSYTAILSRRLDCDIINLGFSGHAYGESAMAEYISELPMSAFVLDYDYNARSEQELSQTHYSFYEKIRNENPKIPIIMMSAPVSAPTRFVVREKAMNASRVIIMESYIKGFKNGDKNLYFIDGEALLGDVHAKDALVDNVHPTDVGFSYMANRICPILKDVLFN